MRLYTHTHTHGYRLKDKKGITLIALIITIIVLLILAGVSINMITGDDGLLIRTSSASEKTRAGEIKDLIGLAISENKMKEHSEGIIKTKEDLIEELHKNGKLTDKELEVLKTEDKIEIGGVEVDFSELIVKVETLAGTTWKMNETLTDYSMFGIFNYEEQTGWDEFPEGCIASNEELSYEFIGFSRTEFMGEFVWGTVHYVDECFVYSPSTRNGFEQGWYSGNTRVFIDGDITEEDIEYFQNTKTSAPTFSFSDIDCKYFQDSELIDWFYENATLLDK